MFLHEGSQPNSPSPVASSKLRVFFITTAFVIVAGGVALGASYVWFNDRVLPLTSVAGIPLGGLDREGVEDVLRRLETRLNDEGGSITFDGGVEKKTLMLKKSSDMGEGIFATFDVQKEAIAIVSYGKNGNLVHKLIAPLRAFRTPTSLTLSTFVFDEAGLRAAMKDIITEFPNEYRDAALSISSLEPLSYTIAPEKQGLLFPVDRGVEEARASYKEGRVPRITLAGASASPRVSTRDIEGFVSRLSDVVVRPIEFMFHANDAAPTSTVSASPNMIASWLTVERDSESMLVFRVKPAPVERYVALAIGSAVDKKPTAGEIIRDETGRVTSFIPAEQGQMVDVTSTVELVNLELVRRLAKQEAQPISVPLLVFDAPDIDPELVMLGIREVIGVGVSNFAGSPANRIKNIRNGAKKLNGLIIPPGTVFSTISSTQPYTTEGGYVPELVIKGSKLVPEIGGGLCQIGTTLFRMAMNSGLDITERRNHSLVVSYYNDLGNGNPGTDATIYEPAPDFRFENDTGHSVLIQTSVNTKTGDLVFTLWGTNDGRKGYYDPPKVLRWIPYGEPVRVVSEEIEAGKENCQKAYRGAETTFTYYRRMPDGTEKTVEFPSYYRPLPQICLVGPTAEVSPETAPPSGDIVSPDEEPLPVILP